MNGDLALESRRPPAADAGWWLPARLSAILRLVPAAGTVADIGSGHGALALALASRGQRVVATERTAATLAGLRRELSRRAAFAGEDAPLRLETRLGEGMSPLSTGEVDVAVVAGMGGRTIVRILDAAAWLPPLLVLQPIQQPGGVEAWIASRGWPSTRVDARQGRRTYTAWSVRVPAAARRPRA
jgi:tRNA (adenine22-N1)-methyltransferase